MNDAKTLLSVKNLHTIFRMENGTIHAVNNVSFSLSRGEVLGIVGESGCGKSVTGLSIMRLVPHPGKVINGEILLDNKDLLSLKEDDMRLIRGSRIAMIFQDPMTSLNPVLTISRQMTEMIQTHTSLSYREAKERVIELLKIVGIPSPEKRINDYPHQFSGGMRQRVMIAMALSCHPDILIADEPTTALDVTIQAQILELMKNFCDEIGTSVLLITHDLGIVAGLCPRVAVMYAGRIVERSWVRDIFSNPHHPYTHSLLTSIPRMDLKRERLQPIGGSPPSLLDPPQRCLFAPRCKYAMEECWNHIPSLEELKNDHAVACFRGKENLW